jgi:hypothetical protein
MYCQIKGWRSEYFVTLNTKNLSLAIRLGKDAIAFVVGAMNYTNQQVRMRSYALASRYVLRICLWKTCSIYKY